MSNKKKYSCKVTLCALDFQEQNKYKAIRFETLCEKPISISREPMYIDVEINEEDYLDGKYTENVYLIPLDSKYEEKKYVYTLFCGNNNVINLNINEEGDCGIEITLMWDIDYDDISDDNISTYKEREIPDIKYKGKNIENFDKLYERKRYTILNAKIEDFENQLFSEKSLEYLKNHKNKSYKYDILIQKENSIKLLSEKISEPKVTLFEEDEKKTMEETIGELNAELRQKFSELEKLEELSKDKKNNNNNLEKGEEYLDAKKIQSQIRTKKENLNDFLKDNIERYIKLKDNFKLYNKKWNLQKFSEKDFKLFLSFSELQLFFKYYKNYDEIQIDTRRKICPKYDRLIKDVLSEKSLNLIDKARIISGFSIFCSSSLFIEDKFPELIIFEKLDKSNPYNLAIEKLNEIYNKLEESSGLFKLLLLFDIGSTKIINQWDFSDFDVVNLKYSKIQDKVYSSINTFNIFRENFEKKMNSNNDLNDLTFPVLSMLSLNTIKRHAIDLLPKFLFKIPYIYDCKAISNGYYRISFFNEEKILYTKDMNAMNLEVDSESCVLPFMIEISHEAHSHIKLRYSNINNQSPLLNPKKGLKQLLCPNDFHPESGYSIEYFFTDNYEELKFLKKRDNDLFELTKSNYWLDRNFNKMKEYVKQQILSKQKKKDFEQDFEDMVFFDKRTYNDDEIMRYMFEKFNS